MQIELSLKEKEEIHQRIIVGILVELSKVDAKSFQKYAYTIKEVGKLISYHPQTVIIFIKQGRTDRKGKLRHLPAHEITVGQYRIFPHELENWLSHF